MVSETIQSKTRQGAPSFLGRVLRGIFYFFASLKLAVMVIASLIIIFAVGTFTESMHGAETAQILVYQTPWLTAVLGFLMLNLTASALSRLPWKKKHVGFVMTHFGIIMILIGSFVTQRWMLDALMPIEEGKTEFEVTIPAPMLYFFSEEEQKEWRIPMKKQPLPWEGEDVLFQNPEDKPVPFTFTVTHDYPKARIHEKLIQTDSGPGTLTLTLKNSFMNQKQRLTENHKTLGNVQMGPATLRFTDSFLPENQKQAPSAGYLEFQFDNTLRQVPIEKDMAFPKTYALEGTEYKVIVTGLFRNAVVVGKDLIEYQGEDDTRSDTGLGKNPAVVFSLEGPGIQEKHTAFARFPDFPTQHGMKPSGANVKIYYREPDSGSKGESHELRFVKKDGDLYYQILDGFQTSKGKVEIGESVSLGWMDFAFTVDEYIPHSKVEKFFTPEPNTSESKKVIPAIQLQVEKDGQKKSFWLAQGLPEAFSWDGKTYRVLYGQIKKPIGFKLLLKDFRVEYYPGTQKPASFESDVVLMDDYRGVSREANISMNEPLVYRGVRIFQASYSQAPGRPDVSVFSVGYDPGIWIKYSGAIIMVAGILIMFYTRRFSSTADRPMT